MIPLILFVLLSCTPSVRSTHKYPHVTVAQLVRTKQTHVCLDGYVSLLKREFDGDLHIRVAASHDAEAAFAVAECIPEMPCPPPRLNTKVSVCGITRYDRGHGWYEIHPVESWEYAH